MQVPTMQIKTPAGPVTINVGDFDPTTMEAFEAPKTEESTASSPVVEPVTDPLAPTDVGAEARRRRP